MNLTMDIYTRENGVVVSPTWADENEYQLAKKFLTDLDATCGESSERRVGKPAFFYLQRKDQLQSLFDFMQSARGKKKA